MTKRRPVLVYTDDHGDVVEIDDPFTDTRRPELWQDHEWRMGTEFLMSAPMMTLPWWDREGEA